MRVYDLELAQDVEPDDASVFGDEVVDGLAGEADEKMVGVAEGEDV